MVTSCNNKKFLKSGEVLLNKNKIRYKTNERIKDKDDLAYSLNLQNHQQPNTRFLGFRTRLWFHNNAGKKQKTKVGKWLKNRIGEPPSIFNDSTMKASAASMTAYLKNKGYYNAKVSPTYKIKKNKEAIVTYTIEPNKALKIDVIKYECNDTSILAILEDSKSSSLIKKGDLVDSQKLGEEKSRIVKTMRNQGYAFFYTNYVIYEIDSSNTEGANVYVVLLTPNDQPHQKYELDSIFIMPNYEVRQGEIIEYDTNYIDGVNFIWEKNKPRTFREQALLKSNQLRTGDLYSYALKKETTNRLLDLGVFKFVNVQLVRQKEKNDDSNKLNVIIRLTPAKKMVFGYDLEAKTTSANVGSGVNLTYTNRNFIRGAETLVFNTESGLLFDIDKSPTDPLITGLNINSELKLYFPRHIGFSGLERMMDRPKTKAFINYNLQQKVNAFTYNTFNTGFGYEWNTGSKKFHQWNIVDYSILLEPTVDSAFQVDILNDNAALQSSFRPYVILSTVYDFTYTGKKNRQGNTWFLRAGAESSGLIINLFDQLNPSQPIRFFYRKDSKGEESWLDYSQYFIGQTDLRFSKQVTPKSSFVSRLFTGVGIPYGNSNVLPYPKQFIIGGPNSMRGWDDRKIGLGRYKSFEDDIVLSGDIRLEFNAEYRFPIYDYLYLEGAIFIDAGNIWLFNKDLDRPGAEFSSNFFNEIAINTGAGIRLNYSYFVIRFDLGIQLRNPYPYDWGSHWINGFRWSTTSPQLGVGYPF